ncbi:hypothetical protein DM01DRAFT_1408090 [Hesseltinella vesiculosa]|uniref:Uncharacterized protein n=1 Tax=Hesseltinella vesiculosa TaxID=101127 RepID=A0A1X2GFR5_9FUNG|nr:hypothetical protein DM01DRAFT_1408090 [Hesseltinella vesiculosa]
MCRRITCSKCNKYTWAGCGRHIDQALAGLKEEEICQCKEEASDAKDQGIVAKLRSAVGL